MKIPWVIKGFLFYRYNKNFGTHIINVLWYFCIEFNRYGAVFEISKSYKPISLWHRKLNISFELPPRFSWEKQ